ncbi:MAG: inositol monophosphatase [Acidobacteria bacterium]|nr:inositol monophosphatase [Acidobacteriota bacterium]
MIDLAIRAAREAGAILQDYAARGFQIENKGRINLVTEADLASERHITQLIGSHFPSHRILAEEGGASGHPGEDNYVWIIDPLDGTTNYSHGFPCYAVSIGIELHGKAVAGVIYDPTRDELFAAERGAGATLNGNKIRVSAVDHLERALVVSGFPYDVRERMEEYLPAWREFLKHTQGARRLGAAAIDMCCVASGRMDGFWENGLNPWDTAAGWVIIEEAGGRVTKLDGSPFDNYSASLLCTNGAIHDQMLAVLASLKNER